MIALSCLVGSFLFPLHSTGCSAPQIAIALSCLLVLSRFVSSRLDRQAKLAPTMQDDKASSSVATALFTLRGKHIRLLEVMQGLMHENGQLGDKVAKLEKNRGVQIDLEERQRIADAARQKGEEEISQLNSELALKVTENQSLQQKISELEREVATQAGQGKAQSDKMLREFELSIKKQEDGEKNRAKLLKALEAIEKDMETMHFQNNAWKTEIVEQKSRCESLQIERTSQLELLAKGQGENKALTDQLTNLKQQMDLFRSNAEKGAEENKLFLERYQAEKQRLQATADERRSRCEYLTEKVEEYANESGKLREELVALQRTLAEERALHPRSGSRFGDFVAIKNENVKLKKAVSDMDRQIQKIGGTGNQKVSGPSQLASFNAQSSGSYSLKSSNKTSGPPPPIDRDRDRDRELPRHLSQPHVLRSVTEPSGGDGSGTGRSGNHRSKRS